MARKRRRKRPAGDLEHVRAAVWETLEMLRHYILKPHDEGHDADIHELCKLSHALFQGVNSYKGLLEASALEELGEMRQAIEELRKANSQTQIRA